MCFDEHFFGHATPYTNWEEICIARTFNRNENEISPENFL